MNEEEGGDEACGALNRGRVSGWAPAPRDPQANIAWLLHAHYVLALTYPTRGKVAQPLPSFSMTLDKLVNPSVLQPSTLKWK